MNAYADEDVKKLNIPLLKIWLPSSTSSDSPAITDIEDITCSFATNPWIADTVAPQLFVPSIG